MSESNGRYGADNRAREIGLCGHERRSPRRLKLRYYKAADSKCRGIVGSNHLDSSSPLWLVSVRSPKIQCRV